MYLAVVIKLFSRALIGWSMSEKNDATLVLDGLTMAIWPRSHKKLVIVHSDQDNTHASDAYQQLLQKHDLLCSMSRQYQHSVLGCITSEEYEKRSASILLEKSHTI